MASTPASSEVDPEEDTGVMRLDGEKTGRAAEYPDFAIIWSFLQNFRHLLHFPDLSLDELEDGFNSHSSENGNVETIEELYKKLLRRTGVSVNPEKWEKSLLKVVKEQGLLCAWDLEQFGYEELKVSSKLELFKVLLECQFDQNDRLKSSVNKGFEAEDLRMQPIGRDLDGFIYWYHEDESNGVRLYTTEEDEVNCESWRLLAGETEELAAVVGFIESKSAVNPKEIALTKREEMKRKGKIKSPGKKKGKKSKRTESSAEEDYDDDNPCARCFSNVRPESILLCDKCDAAYHTACLRPPLLTVPQGDWFCPFCQQLVLLEKLKEKKMRLAARMKLRQRQAKRLGFAGIDLNNILQRGLDDEEDQGIRRSGRSRKNVDYTFREFEEDITSAVENDKKRFKVEVNGEEKELLYSKPAYETGGLLEMARRNTRKSRRLMDLDYESDSESRTSGYEYEGNSDEEARREEGQSASTWHGKLRKQRRVIDDDDEEDDAGNNEVKSSSTQEAIVSKTEQDGEVKDDKEESVRDEEPIESIKSEGKKEENSETPEKATSTELKAHNESKDSKDEKVASSRGESQVGVAAVITAPQSQNATPTGNKIHPHSRIASVAPVARNQQTTDINNFRSPQGYPPEGVFPNPPNFEMLKPQFPSKQGPGHLGSDFAGVNMTGTNVTGNNFTGTSNIALNNAPGMLQGGPSFPSVQGIGVPNTRTAFGGPALPGLRQGAPNFSSANLGFPCTNLGGQNTSAANFGGSFRGMTKNGGTGAASNFGSSTNFVESNPTGGGLGSFGAMKNRPAQNTPGSFWGGQNELSSVYSYQGFPQSTGTAPAPVSSPTNKQTMPPPYPSGSQFSENSRFGGFNQQFQGSSNMQNYMASQQSGSFPDSGYFPAAARQPPPPYSANNALSANVYASPSQESSNLAGNQWTYPESYGYYPGQGNTAGQSF